MPLILYKVMKKVEDEEEKEDAKANVEDIKGLKGRLFLTVASHWQHDDLLALGIPPLPTPDLF